MQNRKIKITTAKDGRAPNLEAAAQLRGADFLEWAEKAVKNRISQPWEYEAMKEAKAEAKTALERQDRRRTGGRKDNAKRAAYFWEKSKTAGGTMAKRYEGIAAALALMAIAQGEPEAADLPQALTKRAEAKAKEIKDRDRTRYGTLARVDYYKAGKLWRRREWKADRGQAMEEYERLAKKAAAAEGGEAVTFQRMERESDRLEAWETIAKRAAILATLTWKKRKYKATIKKAAYAGAVYLTLGGRHDLPPQVAEELIREYNATKRGAAKIKAEPEEGAA